jgi:hypothetical protein
VPGGDVLGSTQASEVGSHAHGASAVTTTRIEATSIQGTLNLPGAAILARDDTGHPYEPAPPDSLMDASSASSSTSVTVDAAGGLETRPIKQEKNMTTPLKMTRDINGNVTYGLSFGKDKFNTILLNAVEQTLTVPAKFDRALAIFAFEPGAVIWVANNATAVGAGVAFALTDGELNPVAREVRGEDVLHFITTNANADVGVAFYAIQ